MSLKKRDYEILAGNIQKIVSEIQRMGKENVQMKKELDIIDRIVTGMNRRLFYAYEKRYGLNASRKIFTIKRAE